MLKNPSLDSSHFKSVFSVLLKQKRNTSKKYLTKLKLLFKYIHIVKILIKKSI